jgi:hypothetical protein
VIARGKGIGKARHHGTGCQRGQPGQLVESMHKAVQKKLNLSDEQWADKVKQMTGLPNEEDMANAKAYAKKVWADLKFLYKQGF